MRARTVGVVAFACLIVCACSESLSIPKDWQTITDEPFYYSISLPANCAITRPRDTTTARRIDAKCGSDWITLYVNEISGVVDEHAFAEEADRAWAKGYELVDTFYKPDVGAVARWLSEDQIQGITKVYIKEGNVRAIATEGRSRFAYSMVMDGPAASKDTFVLISKSLTVKLPATEAGYVILFYLAAVLLAWLLGLSGFWFRKSRVTLSALNQFVGKPNIDASKLEHVMTVQRTRLALLPIVCIVVYAGGVALLGYFYDPLSFLIFAIVGPFLPILGYFGIIREPSEDDIPA